jgi:hypothetical protein
MQCFIFIFYILAYHLPIQDVPLVTVKLYVRPFTNDSDERFQTRILKKNSSTVANGDQTPYLPSIFQALPCSLHYRITISTIVPKVL